MRKEGGKEGRKKERERRKERKEEIQKWGKTERDMEPSFLIKIWDIGGWEQSQYHVFIAKLCRDDKPCW